MSDWRRLGEIALLQIQAGVMTGNGEYDTSLLRRVDALRLTAEGAFGFLDGAWVIDRHHRDHPAARHWHAEDVLSFGFTSHYDHMWEIFRPTPLGIGGENVIVGADGMVKLSDLAGGLRVETETGVIEFDSPQVAEPCVEFTRFMTSRPDATAREVKPDRERLKNGVRGFVVGVGGADPVEIRRGDVVSMRAV